MNLSTVFENPMYIEEGRRRLYIMGDAARKIYFIKEGVVLERYPIEDGRAISFVSVVGDLFGLEPLFSSARSSEAVAYGPAIVKAADIEKLLYYLRKNPDKGLDLYRYLAKRLHDTRKLASEIHHGTIEDNLMSLVRSLYEHNLDTKANGELSVPSADLADCIGTTPETLSRVKGSLVYRGLLDKRRGLRLARQKISV